MLAATLRRSVRPLASGYSRAMATAQPAILNRDMGSNQWYIHFSRTDGADLGTIKKAIGAATKHDEPSAATVYALHMSSVLRETGSDWDMQTQ